MVNQRFIKSKTRSAMQGWLKEIEPEMQRGMDDFMQTALMRSEFTLPCGWMKKASLSISDGATPTAVSFSGVTATIDTDSYRADGGWTVPSGFNGKHLVYGHAVYTFAGTQSTADVVITITNGGTEVTRSRVHLTHSATYHAQGCIGLVSLSDADTIDVRVAVDTDDASAVTADVYFGFVRVAD